VQINGKVKARIQVSPEADNATLEAAAMADTYVQGQLAGKTIKKVIVVPKKMVNIVVG
jgi:leucyl-tRNA synthetase